MCRLFVCTVRVPSSAGCLLCMCVCCSFECRFAACGCAARSRALCRARLAAPAWRPASPPYCQTAAPLSSSVIWNRCLHPVYPSLLRCYTTPPQDKVLGAARRLLECAPAIRLAGVDLSGASLAIDDCYELWDSGEWLAGWLAGARGLGE